MHTIVLEVIALLFVMNLVESIPVKNLVYVFKGFSKLGFTNEKIVIECPINAQFYLWRLYQHNQPQPHVLYEQESKFLTLDSVTTEQSGIYECKSTTGFVNAETNVTLRIIDPKSDAVREICSLPTSPKSQDLNKGLCFYNDKSKNILEKKKLGEDVELDCTAVGTDLKYFWMFNDDTGLKSQIQMGYNISKVIIRSINPENEGVYKCEVTDKFGKKIWQSFTVALSDTSQDTNIYIVGDKQENLYAQPNQRLNLKCEVKNNYIKIHSIKWGKRIPNPIPESIPKNNIVSWDQYTYKLLSSNDITETIVDTNQVLSTLTLSVLDPDHSGIYVCLAMNSRGLTVHKVFNLTVQSEFTTPEPASKSYFFLLYILLPAILIFACICAIIYCCVKSSSKKSHTSLPLKKYASPKQNNGNNKESMSNYYYPASNNRPPLPQPNESQASLVSPNTLTSYTSYGNYHAPSTNQPSCCSSNGV